MLPSSTNFSCDSFPFRRNGGFSQILKLYYCIYKPVGNDWVVKSPALRW